MQAGFESRPITVRRDGTQAVARSEMGEFVSGNYFRTFGLQPRAGRLLTNADDVKGAPMTAVMSYQTWQRDYAADDSVIGSIFWVNTKPVTVVGIAPEGYYGDRISTSPPDFYLPIEEMPMLANAPYVHDPQAQWLYIIGRVKPGVARGSLQEKISALVRQAFASENRLFIGARQDIAGESSRGADAWGRWYSGYAGALFFASASADVDCWSGSIDSLREHCQSAAGTRNGKAHGVVRAYGIRRYAWKDRPPVSDRERIAGSVGWYRWAGCCLCWGDDAG